MEQIDFDRLEEIRTRPLAPGEWADFSEIGVEGVRIAGPLVRIAIDSDGSESVCGLPPRVLRDLEIFVFASILLCHGPIGRRELHFLRTISGLSRADFCAKTGLDPARLDQRDALLSPDEAAQTRAGMLDTMASFLTAISPQIRATGATPAAEVTAATDEVLRLEAQRDRTVVARVFLMNEREPVASLPDGMEVTMHDHHSAAFGS